MLPAQVKAVTTNTSTKVVAPAPDYMPIPPIQTEPNIFGQDQYYTVTFRGNGEAVVSLKVILTNNSEENLNSIDLRVPKINPTDIVAYQVIKEKVCLGRMESIGEIRPIEELCTNVAEPDYYQMWGQAKYQKAKAFIEGDTIQIGLPRPVVPGGSGSFLLYFRGFGYARKSLLGGFEYSFESLKVNDKIRNLQIGISTDSDLVLKEVKGQVNYGRSEMMLAAPVANAQMDSYYQQVGYGQINKTATNLMPLESYTVKGGYADSPWKNYFKELGIGLVVLIGLIGLIGVIVKLFAKNIYVFSGVVGFCSAVLIAGYTLLLWLITQSGFNSYNYYQYGLITTIFTLIISFAVYSLLLFLPAIFLGVKRGMTVGVVTFTSTIIFLTLFFVIFLLSVGFNNSQNIYPVRMMGGEATSVESAPAVLKSPQDAGPED
ncbi:hypothetical protein A2872_01915 [Candidatus Gottesmanbacteria bacterium RIFCSPHIGHO2_01_FULL_42_12]|uniref:Uncharacterized protein n=1 Tax=Candidatus Gottesmanbacteria bacterium RIFCSPHIGHO2_01_FULL_42_12 TaxID=1798377 RepID=A0A1F5Z5Q0_9BACT|nr:MAG: hypothetical protein A2872_01915 [Candidatus Gottesmanbacteria bacterium RIFCSPHIGHO2_01_FULL_42_12]